MHLSCLKIMVYIFIFNNQYSPLWKIELSCWLQITVFKGIIFEQVVVH